jgi:hypothetical protein
VSAASIDATRWSSCADTAAGRTRTAHPIVAGIRQQRFELRGLRIERFGVRHAAHRWGSKPVPAGRASRCSFQGKASASTSVAASATQPAAVRRRLDARRDRGPVVGWFGYRGSAAKASRQVAGALLLERSCMDGLLGVQQRAQPARGRVTVLDLGEASASLASVVAISLVGVALGVVQPQHGAVALGQAAERAMQLRGVGGGGWQRTRVLAQNPSSSSLDSSRDCLRPRRNCNERFVDPRSAAASSRTGAPATEPGDVVDHLEHRFCSTSLGQFPVAGDAHAPG